MFHDLSEIIIFVCIKWKSYDICIKQFEILKYLVKDVVLKFLIFELIFLALILKVISIHRIKNIKILNEYRTYYSIFIQYFNFHF